MPNPSASLPRGLTSGGGSYSGGGDAYGIATDVNKYMTNAAIAPYLANLPNYANMVGKRTENIGQQLNGQLPQDVITQIQQQAAERGIATGTSGGPNANAAYLKALGLNSLQMQQQGNQNLSGAIADTPVPQLFNPASLIVPERLAAQQLAAAQAGRNSGAGSGGGPWAGGGGGGGPVRSSIPRYDPGPNMTVYGPGGGPNYSPSTPSADQEWAAWNQQYGPQNWAGQNSSLPTTPGFSTNDFDPTAYTYAQGGQYGGSVDWNSLVNDPNLPADWADTNWGGAYNQIDASNPDNAFMFE